MTFTLTRGSAPLLISFPHSGTHIPSEIARGLTDTARAVPDTDWHVPMLYPFARSLGAWTLEAHLSRYVVDLNRDPDDVSLYPGQSTTGLCPTDTFDHAPLYRDAPPTAQEIGERVQRYWRPYHHALRGALDEILAAHGRVLLFDAHSIRSQVPRFFDGALAQLNLGTVRGTSCGAALRAELSRELTDSHYEVALDGRFIGGYITRHYGAPDQGVHAVQMEIAQSTYMHETPDQALKPIPARALSALLERLLRRGLTSI